MKKLLLATMASGALAVAGASAVAQPSGNAHGYWAGRICDATESWLGDHGGLPYWEAFEAANYKSRGQCVQAHIEWLKAGNEVPNWAM
jgi:opacity protein-like surface antigen